MTDPKTAADEIVAKHKPRMYCYMGSGMLSNDYDDNVATQNAIETGILEVQACIELLRSLYYIDSAIVYCDEYTRLIIILNELKSRVK